MAKKKQTAKEKPTYQQVHDELTKAHEHGAMNTDAAVDRTREVLDKYFPGQLKKEGKEHYP